MANHNKRINNAMSQWELDANTRSRRQARENACGQVAIGFSFASDWLSSWREIFKPLSERNKAKPKQFWDYFRHSIALKWTFCGSKPIPIHSKRTYNVHTCTYTGRSANWCVSIYTDVLFRNLMMDLVIAMTPYVDGKNVKMLYDLALPWLQVYTSVCVFCLVW